jgi:predicted DsbA family dithiol-disulfide isomerase
MRIDIWSDVVCPWCFVGKRRLERALDRLGWRDRVEVRWRAFQLDPRASRQPGDLRASLERKYGPGAFDAMTRRLGALGEEEGIGFRFDRAVRVNTFDAHRLVTWADDTSGAAGQDALVEGLFVAYFEQGRNIADPGTMVEVAAGAGLDRDRASEVVASDAYAAEVRADLEAAVDRQLTGVPAFVVADRLLIPGAQEVDTFVAVLTRAAERCQPRPGAPSPGTRPEHGPDPAQGQGLTAGPRRRR